MRELPPSLDEFSGSVSSLERAGHQNSIDYALNAILVVMSVVRPGSTGPLAQRFKVSLHRPSKDPVVELPLQCPLALAAAPAFAFQLLLFLFPLSLRALLVLSVAGLPPRVGRRSLGGRVPRSVWPSICLPRGRRNPTGNDRCPLIPRDRTCHRRGMGTQPTGGRTGRRREPNTSRPAGETLHGCNSVRACTDLLG